MDSTLLASTLASFVMAFGGTQLTKAATGLSGSVKLRAVAALFAAVGVVGSKLATSGSFDPTDVELVVKSLLDVVVSTVGAHFFYKATK